MLKAYKYRLYPNREQQEFFAKCFGCARFIYNKMLSDRIDHYKETGKSLKNTPAQYKADFPWLKEVDSLALANAQVNLNKAYNNFFRDKTVGFPKFKSRKFNYFSYTTNNQKGTVHIENGYIKLPKLKSPVRVKQHRQFTGTIKSCTISKTPAGRYFVSVLVETEIKQLQPISSKVGIDVGLKEFAVLSDGSRFANPKHLRKSEKRLAKLQKDLSRKRKGSNNRNKARLKVAKLHEKISNQRSEFLHKLSTKIIRENQAIVIEDLKVKNMLKNHKLSKAISEVSWSMFRTMLEYKAEWYGRDIIIAPSNYASSQLCSSCGNKSSQTKDLSCRVYICPECGLEIDRDYNASLNLLKLAL
ncbi:putative transposase [Peptoclostridium litorale DSM 5388]|uniref:Putative transposase in snaA-snaB intergenic region n=1 Tax=Peptoclostridium litorale DSM 5388 TaxID=1121324 RepID=A0A069RIQ4_PEPLI|nr:IS200/IS605 family element RNA-guided endonuclease TnpB [Peptoclostridium litorale]KDR96653.1 putative transposase in snaA-snaB intergenic region [Peptoclostridium litorale DSM 5388]SIN68040.1 putative transposase [Peptoclostridium litorale DSM 5388]